MNKCFWGENGTGEPLLFSKIRRRISFAAQPISEMSLGSVLLNGGAIRPDLAAVQFPTSRPARRFFVGIG
jgi:hypothetical protein